MVDVHNTHVTPLHARYALGYACTYAWATVLLFSAAFGNAGGLHAAPISMLPGLVACLSSVIFFRTFPSIEGRTAFVTVAALFTAVGTLLCTYPSITNEPAMRFAGLALSGFFAIILIMSWFDAFARLSPRTIVVLSGCTISIAAVMCWGTMASSPEIRSILVSLLPMVAFVLLPATKSSGEETRPESALTGDKTVAPSILGIVTAAIPVRTLVGLAITFFTISSISSLAPKFGLFTDAVSPLSLLIPLACTAFFVASALLVRKHIDPSFLYKVLLLVFAAGVFLLASSIGISASLVFYAVIIADVMMWVVLALLVKKTPVKPHLVFAIGWVAECVGKSLGQSLAPIFEGHMQVFFAVVIMLILVAVGFAFSEGSLMLDVGFEEGDEGEYRTEHSEETQAGATPIEGTGETRASDDPSNLDASGAAVPNVPTCETAASSPDESDAAKGTAGPVDTAPSSSPDGNAAAPANQPSREELVEAFAKAHGISPRERDVLALWIAGRGLKHIENTLFISESTVKSHLRSIYRKCDTHNRDEIIELFEQESGLAE